ncbi:uncharacterized protein P884DRAFT_31317 [Thermothelomyces heterothallicus CBS 202.75]|uniref:uncharacterized protein n=1 Tax=Thermothelomyces heterothallicus CBS 202.75 TaxID=1149848 RepID=UPI003742CE66
MNSGIFSATDEQTRRRMIVFVSLLPGCHGSVFLKDLSRILVGVMLRGDEFEMLYTEYFDNPCLVLSFRLEPKLRHESFSIARGCFHT